MKKNNKKKENKKLERKVNMKRDITIYVILRLIVFVILIRQLISGNFENVFMCILTLMLFTIPSIIDKRFNIKLPNVLESIILMFIFAAEILRRSK